VKTLLCGAGSVHELLKANEELSHEKSAKCLSLLPVVLCCFGLGLVSSGLGLGDMVLFTSLIGV